MKRFLLLFFCVAVTTVAFAFEFAGKTFRGTGSMNGTKVSITYTFKANNRLSGTISIAGQKPDTDNGMHWEVSGDYVNIFDSIGDMSYMEISEENGKTVLIAYDSYGNQAMIFRQVTAPAKSKKGATKRKRH